MDPGGVCWSWNIFDRGSAVAFVHGVNQGGYCDSEGRLLEVVVTHEANKGTRSLTGYDMVSLLYSAPNSGRDVRDLGF